MMWLTEDTLQSLELDASKRHQVKPAHSRKVWSRLGRLIQASPSSRTIGETSLEAIAFYAKFESTQSSQVGAADSVPDAFSRCGADAGAAVRKRSLPVWDHRQPRHCTY